MRSYLALNLFIPYVILKKIVYYKGPSTLATLFSHRWPRFCGGDIYTRRKPLFSSFGKHTAVCGSSVRQVVARPRHRQIVCIHNIHVAATCRPSVLGSATKTRPPVAKQSGQCARALIKAVVCLCIYIYIFRVTLSVISMRENSCPPYCGYRFKYLRKYFSILIY